MQYIKDIKFLAWDSDFFKKKIGRIDYEGNADISSLLGYVKANDYDLIYVFGTKDLCIDQYILDEFQGNLVDRKVMYEKKIIDFIETPPSVSEYKHSKLDAVLEQLAYESGRHSRFRLDSHFQPDDFYRMYKTWIIKSIKKEIADKVFVIKDNDNVSAMVTLKINSPKGEIGLIAVSEQSQGKGYGKALIDVCCNELLQCGVNTIEVPTQMENKSACQFYEKCGFSVKSITNIYHFWL